MISIKKHLLSGVLWSILGKYSNQICSIILGIIMARLLTPQDYGIIGMIAVFLVIGNVIANGGLSYSIIQKQDITEVDLSTTFWLNIGIATIVYIVMVILSPFIATFFSEPKLIGIIRVYFIITFISALTLTQISQLRKNWEFKRVYLMEVQSTIGGGIIGIIAALNGLSYWSIVAQHITHAFIRLFICFYHNNWTPNFVFSKKSVNKLLGFSLSALGIKIIRQVIGKVDTLITGKIGGAAELGLYTRSQFVSRLGTDNLIAALNSIAFPVLSKHQSDEYVFKVVYRKILIFSLFISYPILYILFNYSANIVLLLLGEKWIEVATYVPLFVIIVIFYPINELALLSLMAKGHIEFCLNIELIFNFFLFVSLIIGAYFYGVVGLIYTKIIISFLNIFFSAYLYNNYSKYKYKEQLSDIINVIIPLLISALSINYIIQVIQMYWILEIALFSILYLIANLVVGNEFIAEIRKFIGNSLSPNNQ